ncbi:MAG: T9SS type A sorting domain-containing protein [Bacteroidetes bacterium]|jgi:hypothetical protein|nr:T9SS type A sorting domain-containing protein [Bacteroidota bacterium]MBT5528119.1 T9SS type A sorting domain-containing protein [Cytophagia bacterium]MBT3801030.1 T9SS type A sorting domain-containing protein [Bacteroidota bacterium]MBT3935483.1 T9SS type A sorting domain-containing protein [Bacteroidota bacterium]MBT4339657.1 T9SS type A sorting domain-containing protein [Bacteroidota bacterium]
MKTVSKCVLLFLFLTSSSLLSAQQMQSDYIWNEKVCLSDENFENDIKPINTSNWWKCIKDKPTTAIKENQEEKSIKAYPNPSNGMFNVEVSKGVEKLSICSASGAIVFEMDLDGWEKVIPVDLSTYDPGIYFIFMSRKEINDLIRISIAR